jgi:hypothetical protein
MKNPEWAAPHPTVTDDDIKGLSTAHKQERKLMKDGWRYYKVSERLMVLVPFGEDGKPTKKGMQMIEARKSQYDIK